MPPNRQAFLDMLAFSEIGPELLALSDNGYNVLVGSTPSHPLLFDDYSDHPNILNEDFHSTAAGRYQILHHWWVPYKEQLGLLDFGPESQDAAAIQQIRETGGLPLIDLGQIEMAINKCAHLWASLPGAGYQQHENKLQSLLDAYERAGGRIG